MSESFHRFVSLVSMAGPEVAHFLPQLYEMLDKESQIEDEYRAKRQAWTYDYINVTEQIFAVLGIQRRIN